MLYIFETPWVSGSGPWPNLSFNTTKVCVYNTIGLFNDVMLNSAMAHDMFYWKCPVLYVYTLHYNILISQITCVMYMNMNLNLNMYIL